MLLLSLRSSLPFAPPALTLPVLLLHRAPLIANELRIPNPDLLNDRDHEGESEGAEHHREALVLGVRVKAMGRETGQELVVLHRVSLEVGPFSTVGSGETPKLRSK